MTAHRRFRRAAGLTLLLAAAVLAAPASAVTPTHPMAWKSFTSQGDMFLNYDGEKLLNISGRDWAINMIFYGDASESRVKDFFAHDDRGGFTHGGSDKSLAYSYDRQKLRIDTEGGRKTGCDAQHTDSHYRPYGGSNHRMYDPDYGYFVVASTHRDHNDADHGDCHGEGARWYGYSEHVENEMAAYAQPYLTVNEDAKFLNNAESDWVDNDSHRWENNGYATLFLMP